MTEAVTTTADPWNWFETRYDGGITIRVARTLADAEAARELIRDAWAVEDDERYFYGLFDDAHQLFERVIMPSTRHGDLRELDAICVMIDARDEEGRVRSVGTFSYVLDHRAKTIEIGRGAIARAWQGRRIPILTLGPMHRLLATLPEYAVTTDATTIARGARATAEALGVPTVALHPSNFTVQAGAVDHWHQQLVRRRGPLLAAALLRRSPVTGLGRFTTSYHCRLPRELRPARPVLTAAQRPFFDHTCRVCGLDELSSQDQGARLRKAEVSDRTHTATRTLIDPEPAFDLAAQLADASDQGLETVVVQVPCDTMYRPLSERLEARGAILGGVFADAHGCWRASYTLLVGPEHEARVRSDLAVLAEHGALDGDAGVLLRLVLEQATSAMGEAC